MTDYAQNPNDPNALNALAPFKPDYVVQQKQALAEQDRKQKLEYAARRTEVIGQAAMFADDPQKWDAVIDQLSQQFPDLAQYKGKFSPETRAAAISAAGQMQEYLKKQEGYTLRPGDIRFGADGKQVAAAPFAPHYGTVKEGETAYVTNPGASGSLTVDNFLPAIVKQESGGNYKAVNRESGAMGAYQVMPATGQSLAGQIGLPWRPDLMTSDTPEAKQYQDQIGRAAVKEAVDASGGNPVEAAMYYHGGSDKSKWGPRTQKYGREVAARLGNGTNVIAQGPAKASKEWTTLTPQEVQDMGLQPGVYQRGPNGEIKPVSGQTGGGLSRQQMGAAQQKLKSLGAIEGQLNRVLSAEKSLQSGGFSGPVMGRIPGSGSLDSESAAYDKAVAQLAPLIRQLTRTPGEGSMSDYESRLASLALPARSDNPAARAEAYAGLRELIANIKAGYQELLGGQAAPAQPAPRSAPAPQNSAPPPAKVIRYDAKGNRIQ